MSRPFRFGVMCSAKPTAAEWKAFVRRIDDLGYDVLNMPNHRASTGFSPLIAMATACSPRLLLADEPTGSLDEETADTVFGLLRHLVQTRGIAVVLATHERRFAEQCDRVLRVRSGRIETA